MNVLIIGLGSIARKHISALRMLSDEVNIYALRSGGNSEKTEGVVNIYDLNTADALFQFAIISNPTAAHYSTIEQLLSLGVPLFIEKPLFHLLEKGELLVKKCMAEGIKTYVACNLRFHPCIKFIKRFLEDNNESINEVNIYSGSYLPDWRPQRDFRSVYSANPELGGGVHLDLIHELDYTYWLLGAPIDYCKHLTNKSTLDIQAIDFARYALFYDNFTASITLNYYRRDSKREIEILLEHGTLKADLLANTVTFDTQLLFEKKIEIYYTYVEQMKYFLENIHGDSPMMNNIEEAFEILKICLR
jgi:predicted dehydrogenase